MKPLRIRWPVIGSYVAVGAICAWGATLVLIPPDSITGTAETIVSLIGTLIGAFAGAWAAFKLQVSRENSRARSAEYTAATQVFVALSQMSNHLWNIRLKLVEPHRNHKFRHLVMPATTDNSVVKLALNPADLSFLIGQGDEINFIGEAITAAWGYESALATVEARSLAWVTRVKPLFADFADAHPDLEGRIPGAFLATLPVTVHLELKGLTNSMIEILDEEIERTLRVANDLGSRIARAFPEAGGPRRVHFPEEPRTDASLRTRFIVERYYKLPASVTVSFLTD